jgi:hypothetical protein
VHVAEPPFGSPGSGSGQFKEPLGIASNNTTHDVYVVDSGNNRVQKFSSSGSAFISEFDGSGSPTGVFSGPTQIAVDNSANPVDPSHEDVYVVDIGNHVIDKFNAAGAYEGQLTGTCAKEDESPPCSKSTFIPFESGLNRIAGLAVAPNGAVWVMEKEGKIDSFSDGQPNQFIASRTTAFGGFIHTGLAADGEENLYMNPGPIAKVTSSGKTVISPFDSWEESSGHVAGAVDVAVDATHEEAYVESLFAIGRANLAGESQELPFGLGSLVEGRGVAVDPGSSSVPGSGTVYATDRAANRVEIFAPVRLPTVSLGEPSEQLPKSLTINGSVNPEGEAVTSCVFEYDTREYREGEGPHGSSGVCEPGTLGTGSTPVAVSRHVEALTPETKYYYRLVAKDSGGVSEAFGDVTPGPNIGSEFVTEVTSTSAALHTSIDPNGDDTHYYFEYGTSSAYGSYAPAEPPGVDLGAAKGAQALSPVVVGLQASTVYHYRVVATQEGEAFTGPDRTFTTQSAVTAELGLPDGRSWELVSPAEKKDALIEFLPGYAVDMQAASDGSGITYAAFGQLGEGVIGHESLSHVLSMRGDKGWSSRDITLPNVLPAEEVEPWELIGGGVEYRQFSPNLSVAVVEALKASPPLSPEVTEACTRLYLRDNPTSRFVPLVGPEMVPGGTNLCGEGPGRERMRVYAATPDLNRFVVWSPVGLATGPYTGELYEVGRGPEAQVQAVGVYPDREEYHGTEGVDMGGDGAGFGAVQRAMSSDGRWIAWTPGDPYNKSNIPLYVRDMVSEKTVQVGGPHARYQTMNSDGSEIFFVENGDLYVCETARNTLTECPVTDLTASHGAGETSAGVQELVSDVSEDGSYVYFVATGVLSTMENAMKEKAVAGADNVYVLHNDGSAWEAPTFVATLSREDEKDWYRESFGTGTSAPALAYITSRVSPDGRYLTFMSNRPLTGYDNIDRNSTPGEQRRDEEVYLYDAVAGRLVCASCNPTGARPSGVLDSRTRGTAPLIDRAGSWNKTLIGGDHWLAGSIPGWDEAEHQRSVYQPRYLSDSGRLFFDSPDALVPQATNGLTDVYEYEPPGVGSCTSVSTTFSGQSGGCVSLVSSGISGAESAFFDASENGDDVFFITTSRLVGEDFDSTYDMYDAHVCSSSAPCHTQPESPVACVESCKPAPSPQPELFGPPPSATFSGAGNVMAQAPDSNMRPKALSRAQKLARTLRACRRKRSGGRGRRAVCEREARRRYAIMRSGKAKTAGKGVR